MDTKIIQEEAEAIGENFIASLVRQDFSRVESIFDPQVRFRRVRRQVHTHRRFEDDEESGQGLPSRYGCGAGRGADDHRRLNWRHR